ncbi:hypothetical protein D3C80_2125430 [compost metagenome]
MAGTNDPGSGHLISRVIAALLLLGVPLQEKSGLEGRGRHRSQKFGQMRAAQAATHPFQHTLFET